MKQNFHTGRKIYEEKKNNQIDLFSCKLKKNCQLKIFYAAGDLYVIFVNILRRKILVYFL
jgi:hypothetical protein